jgi:hypothetical protein
MNFVDLTLSKRSSAERERNRQILPELITVFKHLKDLKTVY